MNIFLAQYLHLLWEEGLMISSLVNLMWLCDSHFVFKQPILLSTVYKLGLTKHEKAQKHFVIFLSVRNENLF